MWFRKHRRQGEEPLETTHEAFKEGAPTSISELIAETERKEREEKRQREERRKSFRLVGPEGPQTLAILE